jgi:hypothetical protein
MTLGNGSDEAALEYTLRYNPPMDLVVGERNLKEAKEILDQLGLVYLLSSGTCLGATRDKAFILWDDDIDLIAILGVNALTDEAVAAAAQAFRDRGYYVREWDGAHSKIAQMVKDHVRLSLECLRIEDDHIYAYPGIRLPANMFTQPKEIEFLGEKFLVPNPPEEYLRLKYGEDWMTPKKAGVYEKDVVEKVPGAELAGWPCRLRVLDLEGKPVSEAEVVLVGGGRSRTDNNGYAEVTLPAPDCYALTIKYPGHEQVLYMEDLEPGRTYVYKADAALTAATHASGSVGTLGNMLLPE